MQPEGSLPHLQVPATYPCLEPARSSPYPFHIIIIIYIIIRDNRNSSKIIKLNLSFSKNVHVIGSSASEVSFSLQIAVNCICLFALPEDVWEVGGTALLIRDQLRYGGEWSVDALTTFIPEKDTTLPTIEDGLAGPQIRSGLCGADGIV